MYTVENKGGQRLIYKWLHDTISKETKLIVI